MERGTENSGRRPRSSPGLPELIPQGLAYVPAVARRFAGSGLDRDELISAGNLGLVQAALRFDSSRNTKFITYADWWIRKAIFEAIETLSGPVRLPRYRYERLRWLKQASAQWAASHGDLPSHEQLAGVTGLLLEQVRRLLASEPRGLSLDHPSHPGDDRPMAESIPDPSSACPQQTLIRRDLGQRLRRELGSLEQRAQRVIRLRFGLDGEPPRTLREAARLLGLSRERVRQIELAALLEIRREF